MKLRQRAIEMLRIAGYKADESPAIAQLCNYVAQRPGMDFRNYQCSDWKQSRAAYMGDLRPITKDLNRFFNLLCQCKGHGVTDADVIDAAKHSYSGRMEISPEGIEYCTGQYWPTEYRRCACVILQSALHEKQYAHEVATVPT